MLMSDIARKMLSDKSEMSAMRVIASAIRHRQEHEQHGGDDANQKANDEYSRQIDAVSSIVSSKA